MSKEEEEKLSHVKATSHVLRENSENKMSWKTLSKEGDQINESVTFFPFPSLCYPEKRKKREINKRKVSERREGVKPGANVSAQNTEHTFSVRFTFSRFLLTSSFQVLNSGSPPFFVNLSIYFSLLPFIS